MKETENKAPGPPSSLPRQGLRHPEGAQGWTLGCRKEAFLGGSNFWAGAYSCSVWGQGEARERYHSYFRSHHQLTMSKLILTFLTQREYWFSCWSSPFTHPPVYYQPAFSFSSSHAHTHSSLPLHTDCTQVALCWETRPHHSDHPKTKDPLGSSSLEGAGQGNGRGWRWGNQSRGP